MASFNKVILLGNLTRDPEMRYLPNNTPVVGFGMACNRRFRDAQGQDREEVMFIDCSAFGKQAEVINQYCHKGELLFVEGRLRLETWEDKQGGGKRSKHSVTIDNFQLMPRRDGGGGAGAGAGAAAAGAGGGYAPEGQQAAPRRAPAARPAPQRPAPASEDQPPYDDQQQFKPDDIPF